MSTEQLAEELHKFYRAAFKAMHGTTRPIGQFQCDAPGHDHGWDHCNKKQYFRRRAESLNQDLGSIHMEGGQRVFHD